MVKRSVPNGSAMVDCCALGEGGANHELAKSLIERDRAPGILKGMKGRPPTYRRTSNLAA